MNGTAHLEQVAALLERAYRLALVLQEVTDDGESARFIAAELVLVLDETRVSLLEASGVAPHVPRGRAAAGERAFRHDAERVGTFRDQVGLGEATMSVQPIVETNDPRRPFT